VHNANKLVRNHKRVNIAEVSFDSFNRLVYEAFVFRKRNILKTSLENVESILKSRLNTFVMSANLQFAFTARWLAVIRVEVQLPIS
jgi:hypothetical protein